MDVFSDNKSYLCIFLFICKAETFRTTEYRFFVCFFLSKVGINCVVVYKFKVMYFCLILFLSLSLFLKYTKCKLCTMSVPIPILCKDRFLISANVVKNQRDLGNSWSTF